jgi:hypothetical protein
MSMEPMNDHARGCEGREYTCKCGHDAQQAVRLSEAEARIAELEAENERLKHRLTEVAHQREDVKWTALTHGLNKMSAEALLKEAGKALEPFAKLGDIVLAEAPADSDEVNIYVDCEDNIHWVRNEDFRAARAISDKIGGKDD